MLNTDKCTVTMAIKISEDDRKRNIDLAVTLSETDLGFNEKTGWNVMGVIHEDAYLWVNYFEAHNIIKSDWIVCGNFEDGYLKGSCKEALEDFLKHYKPQVWDYGDI